MKRLVFVLTFLLAVAECFSQTNSFDWIKVKRGLVNNLDAGWGAITNVNTLVGSNATFYGTITAKLAVFETTTNMSLSVTNLLLQGTANAGGFGITNMLAGTNPLDAVNYTQLTNAGAWYVRRDGTAPMTGDWNYGNFGLTNVGTISASNFVQTIIGSDFGKLTTTQLTFNTLPAITRVSATGIRVGDSPVANVQLNPTVGVTVSSPSNIFHSVTAASANYGVVSIGAGGFGGGLSNFIGSVNGTYLAINSSSNFTGNLIDAQFGGFSQFSVLGTGEAQFGGVTPIAGVPLTVAKINAPTYTGSSLQFNRVNGYTELNANNDVALRTANVDYLHIKGNLMTLGGPAATSTNIIQGLVSLFTNVAPATANYGAVSLGGGWAGLPTNFTGNVNGTYLAINSSSNFTGNLIDAQLGGSSKFKVDAAGAITANSITNMSGNIHMSGIFHMNNNAGSLGIGSSSADTWIERVGVPTVGTLRMRASSTTGDVSLQTTGVGTEILMVPSGTNVFRVSSNAMSVLVPQTTYSSDAIATANYGVVNIGAGGFAGGVPNFVGSGNGTYLAINATPGFTGKLLDFQVGGTNKVSINSTGQLLVQVTNSTATAPAFGFSEGIYTNGFYRQGFGELGLAIQGTSKVFWNANTMAVALNITPYTSGSVNIGSAGNYWGSIYGGNLIASNSLTVTSNLVFLTAGSLTVPSLGWMDGTTTNGWYQPSGATYGFVINGQSKFQLASASANIRHTLSPFDDDTAALGTAALRFNRINLGTGTSSNSGSWYNAGTIGIGTNSTTSKLFVNGDTGTSTNLPLQTILGTANRNANFFEILGNGGTTTNFYVDKTGNVQLGAFDYVSTNLVFPAPTVIGETSTNKFPVAGAPQGGLVVVGWPSDLPTDSAWNCRFSEAGTAMVVRTCIVLGPAYTNTFRVTGL